MANSEFPGAMEQFDKRLGLFELFSDWGKWRREICFFAQSKATGFITVCAAENMRQPL
jgi:hypothetical protein